MTDLPPRIAIDADGNYWRCWDDGTMGMPPVSTGNSPSPLTYYVPEADLAAKDAEIERLTAQVLAGQRNAREEGVQVRRIEADLAACREERDRAKERERATERQRQASEADYRTARAELVACREKTLTDWTASEDGRSNSSEAYLAICAEVERILRGDAHMLIAGGADSTARLIVSNLAHRHGMAPQAARAAAVPAKEETKVINEFTSAECWPVLTAKALDGYQGLGGKALSDDCPHCGHLVALHSRRRGCVGCALPKEPGARDTLPTRPEGEPS